MATKKPKGLGLGLEALLGPKVSDTPAAERDGTPTTLKLEQLQAGKYQPRTRMDEGSLYELAESIKAQGIMQPILVRPLGEQGRQAARNDKSQGPSPATGTAATDSILPQYEIIAGERRFRAARLAGLREVPVLVKAVPDESAAAMALIENIQREDLNPLEEAQGLKRLTDEFGLTHEQAAQAVGRSRSAASNLLRLLNLSSPVQNMLMAGDLDMGHARALLPLEGAVQITTASEIAARKLSVREAEKLVAKTQGAARQAPLLRVKSDKSRDVLRLEEELADALGATVEVRVKKRSKRGQSGELAIHFDSLDALSGILDRLRGGAA
ncbi:ParB/RepB/Spo0J family partition protein [Roseateles saccharophilus]|uniref:ParB family chromosome partitioning protein n=1 Tax=Roseateles saccharophilus TaxID=304 RepID=A0A4R3UN49_ROSSA|nr:ParB/RepB/Spo0J family partition protein [Roseateles saccharophilus]MDG0834273.1 ParB/RepB/Spo0J family partition protein [Roseateles saccharophilus]TCU91883.1 ParB family chromosome partitioning protein [Roseateles saccharophilus]